MALDIIGSDVLIQGSLTVIGAKPAYTRTDLSQESDARQKIPLESFRVWDAFATNLPGTSATDDLALIGGTFATAAPSIQTSDLKSAGSTTRYCRVTASLPMNYVAGQAVTLRIRGLMITTVASVAATVDAEVFRSGDDTSIGSDLCATAAQSINNLTPANKDFTITPTTLLAGDTLDIRLTMVVNDGTAVTAVIGCIGGVELRCSVKG
jgi:hypothetical protein